MARRLIQAENGISFMELLLDETICRGEIWIPQKLVSNAGGVNMKLDAKHKYELLLRIACETNFVFEEQTEESAQSEAILLGDDNEMGEGWKTDCYIVGKYSEQLRECGYFDIVLASLIEEASAMNRQEQTLVYLEQMIRRSQNFYEIDDDTRPILIYKGDDVCHNVLTVFAEQFGAALERQGAKVIYFDVSKEEISSLAQYVGLRFKAIVGVQTYLFTVKMKEEEQELHELLHGPKFNFIFDHPIWAKTYMNHKFSDFCVLTLDENYAKFIRKYYDKNAIFFPPAGILKYEGIEWEEKRSYGISFVGTCGDYKNEARLLHQMDRNYRFTGNRFLLKMRKNPNITAEEALKQVLIDEKREVSDSEFYELLYELRRVIYCVTHYYRYNVFKQLLESGLKIDVFGTSWKYSDLSSYANLICHDDVTVEESLEIWKNSKLSLNIMSWHKGGFTERMSNIMLAGAVLVTDKTQYLEEHYTEEEVISFSLDALEQLSEKISTILSDDKMRSAMARSAYEKTKEMHTWDKRAEEFLALLEQG